MLKTKSETLSFGTVEIMPMDEETLTMTFILARNVEFTTPCIHQYSVDQLRRFFSNHAKEKGLMTFLRVFCESPLETTDKDPIYFYIELYEKDEGGNRRMLIKSSDDSLEIIIPTKLTDYAKLEKLLSES